MLGATAVLFWLARRDLSARAAPPPAAPAADTRELEQLCATLETLVTDLARRLEALEHAARREPTPSRLGSPPLPVREGEKSGGPEAGDINESASVLSSLRTSYPSLTGRGGEPKRDGVGSDPRHAPLYALLDQGITDPVEIARRTGLGRGEVELILSLRARRAL